MIDERDVLTVEPESLTVRQLNEVVKELRERLHNKSVTVGELTKVVQLALKNGAHRERCSISPDCDVCTCFMQVLTDALRAIK